jgi:hypothetical protein
MTDRRELAREALVATSELEHVLDEHPENIVRCFKIAKRIGDLRQQELRRLVRSIAEVRRHLTKKQRQLLELEKARF